MRHYVVDFATSGRASWTSSSRLVRLGKPPQSSRNQTTEVNLEALTALAQLLEVTSGELLTDEPDPFEENIEALTLGPALESVP
jgi:hypothetical protein